MENSQTANIGIEKLKSSFVLGMTSNSTTVIGLVGVWIAFSKAGCIDGFWASFLTVISFLPIFMGDALDSYCMNRIKVEKEKGWADIQITDYGRDAVSEKFIFFRLLSLLPSIALAVICFTSFLPEQNIYFYSKVVFAILFSASFFKSYFFMKNYLAPKIPAFGGKPLTTRVLIVSVAFLLWFVHLWAHAHQAFSKLFILANGFVYFFIVAVLHPLPSRFSIFRPGRAPKRKFSFKVEIITEDSALGNWDEILKSTDEIDKSNDFEYIGNAKMPLLELPLFHSWGKIYINSDKTIILLVLASETKNYVHRSLVSSCDGLNYITTDFGAPKAKFPEKIKYKNIERGKSLDLLLKKHCDGEVKFENLGETNSKIYDKLEEIVKHMISFLESELPQKLKHSTDIERSN